MPRAALMSWFQYHNYGTALQVFALSETMSRLGLEVQVVNYRAKGVPQSSSPSVLIERLYKGVSRRLRKRSQVLSYSNTGREQAFDRFLEEHLSFTSLCKTKTDLQKLNETYEVFVCGSDQIWAPSVFDPHYFLDFAGDNKLKVAYAPSVGLPKIANRSIAKRMGELAARIDRLSTREESGSRLIEEITGREVTTVLDPTLLLGADEWRLLCGRTEKQDGAYLLAYMLGRNEAHWESIEALASALGMKMKVIPVFQDDTARQGCITEPIGPKEFVALINGASFVCTDSFHGVAFSINFQKEFCVFERFSKADPNNQNSRIYNILSKTGLEDRLACEGIGMTRMESRIVWAPVHEALEAERYRSLGWLSDSLQLIMPDNEDSELQGVRNA